MQQLQQQLSGKVRSTFAAHVESPDDIRFRGANSDIVRHMVPSLMREHEAPAIHFKNVVEENPREELSLMSLQREVFLRAVSSQYSRAIQEGIIPRNSLVARILLHSASE